jgi:predicted anti-sigma-YlaC factor YlaD
MTAAWNADPTCRPTMAEAAAQLTDMVAEMAEEDGVVPSRASEIRAKRKRKKVSRENRILDVDTRKATAISTSRPMKAHASDIV